MTAMELPTLPDAYQKVDYVVGTSIGTNFDSGVAGNNNNLRIKGCISFITATGGYHAVLGNYASETKNAWRFMLPSANIKKDRIVSIVS